MRLQEETRPTRLKLDLEGMSCASCAARVEQKLNSIDGVEATVNFATEQATVQRSDETPVAQIIAAVESVGYGARVVEPGAQARPSASRRAGERAHAPPSARCCADSARSAARDGASPPLLGLGVACARRSRRRWSSTRGSVFTRAALKNARHFAATMDTLISLGTTAAWLWSTIVLVAGVETDTYFEVGRRRDDAHPARALPRSAGEGPLLGGDPEAPRARREGGARPRGRSRDPSPRRPSSRSVISSWSVPARGSRRTESSRKALAIDEAMLTGESVPVEVAPGSDIAGANGEHVRSPRRPCDEGRRRYCAGADRSSRGRGSIGQGAGPAPRRPRLRDLRSDRDRPRVTDARRLVAGGSISRQRLHGRRLGADHRLPLRVGPRHPDRTDGRDRARCADGRTHQGAGNPGTDAESRHDRPRQDRHGHRGQDGARRGFAVEWSDARRGPAPRRRRGSSVRASDRRGRRVGRAGGDRRAAGGRGVPQRARRRRVWASSKATK